MQGGEEGGENGSGNIHSLLMVNERSGNATIFTRGKTAPSTPELQQRPKIASPKTNRKNHSLQSLGMSLDEKSTLDKPTETVRRHSLIPPNHPSISVSVTSEESLNTDRPRRPSTHSLGPFSDFSDRRGSRGSIFGSLGIGDHPPSNQNQRRPSFQMLGDTVMNLFGSK